MLEFCCRACIVPFTLRGGAGGAVDAFVAKLAGRWGIFSCEPGPMDPLVPGPDMADDGRSEGLSPLVPSDAWGARREGLDDEADGCACCCCC